MKDLYFTQSLNMAAFLISKGFSVDGKVKKGNKVTLYFEKSPNLYNAVQEYNNDNELKKFITAFKEVKEIIKNS